MKTISLVTNLQFFVLGGNFWKGKTDEMGIALQVGKLVRNDKKIFKHIDTIGLYSSTLSI